VLVVLEDRPDTHRVRAQVETTKADVFKNSIESTAAGGNYGPALERESSSTCRSSVELNCTLSQCRTSCIGNKHAYGVVLNRFGYPRKYLCLGLKDLVALSGLKSL
jgi:hypothetical protein